MQHRYCALRHHVSTGRSLRVVACGAYLRHKSLGFFEACRMLSVPCPCGLGLLWLTGVVEFFFGFDGKSLTTSEQYHPAVVLERCDFTVHPVLSFKGERSTRGFVLFRLIPELVAGRSGSISLSFLSILACYTFFGTVDVRCAFHVPHKMTFSTTTATNTNIPLCSFLF